MGATGPDVAGEGLRSRDVTTCLLTVDYDGERALVIVLARDGSINRMGDGRPLTPQTDSTLYIGVVEEPLLDRLMEVIPDAFVGLSGRYDEPSKRRGIVGECHIVYGFADGRVSALEVVWGADKQSLPAELYAYLSVLIGKAIEVTDPWWKAQPRPASG
jgi:hypothetical protein